MSREVSRRTFLRGSLTAAAAVVGFDTVLRGWVSAAELTRGQFALAEGFPSFDGSLLTDGASLAAAADDYGHMVHRRPSAVLRPGSVSDVVELVRFARRNRIKVAARGQGHSTQGQAQVEAGVVIDMSTLAAVREVNAGEALVEGGARWLDLLQQTVPQGLTPPTPERAAGLVADNRALFERATELGGKRYPFDSVPMTKQDWQKHYQPAWGQLASAKHIYDPDGILTPGQGIF